MKTLRFVVTIFLLCAATTAMASPASENTIKKLLVVTQAHELTDNIAEQVKAMLDKTIQETLRGKTPNEKQQQAITNMKNKMVVLVQKELRWEKMEAMTIRLYQETFTEEELTGMLSFYQTPAGKAVIKKMPVLMQKIMEEMRKMMMDMSPEMQKIEKEFLDEVKDKETEKTTDKISSLN